MVEHAVELGEQRADPGRPLGHLHAEHVLDREHDAELGGERAEPVVAVGQHDDLAVVAHLEELLDAAVHVADDRLAGHDALAVERQPQPQDAVGRRVLRPDVEHHVGRGEARADAGGDLGHERRQQPLGPCGRSAGQSHAASCARPAPAGRTALDLAAPGSAPCSCSRACRLPAPVPRRVRERLLVRLRVPGDVEDHAVAQPLQPRRDLVTVRRDQRVHGGRERRGGEAVVEVAGAVALGSRCARARCARGRRCSGRSPPAASALNSDMSVAS